MQNYQFKYTQFIPPLGSNDRIKFFYSFNTNFPNLRFNLFANYWRWIYPADGGRKGLRKGLLGTAYYGVQGAAEPNVWHNQDEASSQPTADGRRV